MPRSVPTFQGHPKHLQVLLKAIEEDNPALWADFCAAQGPFFSADLRGANLSGKSLRGFSLRRARLQNVDFSNADLSNADLTGAHLAGASFSGAKTLGAKLPKPKIKAVRPPSGVKDSDTPRTSALDVQKAAQILLAERQAKEKEKLERQKLKGPLFQIEDDDE